MKCPAYLVSDVPTDEQKQTSHGWFRKSVSTADIALIKQKKFDNCKEEMYPCLAAGYLNILLRSIPGSLINIQRQKILILLISRGM